MEVGESEVMGTIDDDGIGIGNINTVLNNSCGEEYVVIVVRKVENNLFKILLVVLILEFIANLIVAIFRGAQTASIVASVVAVIGAILTIIQYVMFLVYLAKARKMLANA